jgi:hypothetical protein
VHAATLPYSWRVNLESNTDSIESKLASDGLLVRAVQGIRAGIAPLAVSLILLFAQSGIFGHAEDLGETINQVFS